MLTLTEWTRQFQCGNEITPAERMHLRASCSEHSSRCRTKRVKSHLPQKLNHDDMILHRARRVYPRLEKQAVSNDNALQIGSKLSSPRRRLWPTYGP
jgi:hypothetical protein